MSLDDLSPLLEALKLSPDNIPLRLLIANRYYDAEEYEAAEEHYRKIIRQVPKNYDVKFRIVETSFNLNNYSRAIVILEDLLENASENPEYLLMYARLLFKEKDMAAAQEYYQRALELDSELSDTELDNHLRMPSEMHLDDDFDENYEESYGFLEKPDVSFNDVGGMNRIKKEIDLKIIKPLEHKGLYEAYGKKVGGGILLYGPPGCGKTHIARATAGEINAKFISVGINDILDMWIGNSEKNLHNIFDVARKNTPCVLFFDEIDAIGASRSDMRQSSGRHLINQFLAELDGIDANNDGLLVLGATNTPWHLDQAFRRPGRFDRIIFVSPPDLESRKSILDIVLKGKPTDNIDAAKIAAKTQEYSGADLKAVVEIAIEAKLEASFATGVPQPLTTKDLLQAIKKHNASTKEWFNSAKNYAIYANESGLYDDILTYLKIKK